MTIRAILQYIIISAISLCAVGVTFAQEGRFNPIDVVNTNSATIETNGVALSLATYRAHYSIHESVVLKITLKDIGDVNIGIADRPTLVSFDNIFVLPPRGQRAKQTAYANERMMSFLGGGGGGLQPGQESKDSYALNRLFDMTLSGEYRIFVRKEVTLFNPERKIVLQTPAITIRIDDNPIEDEQSKK